MRATRRGFGDVREEIFGNPGCCGGSAGRRRYRDTLKRRWQNVVHVHKSRGGRVDVHFGRRPGVAVNQGRERRRAVVNDTVVQVAKATGDVAAVGVTVATVLSWLPAAAAILTIVWTAVRIYETDTVQKIIKNREH